jgi:Glutamate-cysteine ligase family 2(GCS2)
MAGETDIGFRFGIEAEYMLVNSVDWRPLWYRDLQFEQLHSVLESIPFSDLPPLDGLELERPHRKLMPYVVEGYHVPDPDLNPIDLWPKGIEIRTPVCQSIDECLNCLKILFERLQAALAKENLRAVALSHHPVEHHFEGPQNKRRHDFWQWAMTTMTTYGPDINISLPPAMFERLDLRDLHRKVNYYAPALTALTLASPFRGGKLWQIRGQVGKSLRTYRRSVVAPAIEVHPEENGRLEFKSFEMTNSLTDFRNYLLLWLTLLVDNELAGRATDETRIYDLGQIARLGLDAESAADRAAAILESAYVRLPEFGFQTDTLVSFSQRLEQKRIPADDLIVLYEKEGSLPPILKLLSNLEAARFP